MNMVYLAIYLGIQNLHSNKVPRYLLCTSEFKKHTALELESQ